MVPFSLLYRLPSLLFVDDQCLGANFLSESGLFFVGTVAIEQHQEARLSLVAHLQPDVQIRHVAPIVVIQGEVDRRLNGCPGLIATERGESDLEGARGIEIVEASDVFRRVHDAELWA